MVVSRRLLAALFAGLGLMLSDASVFAQSDKHKDKQDRKEQKEGKPHKEKKQHKHKAGKDLLGDKIKKNGKHKLEDHGKHSAYVDVANSKVAGVKVKHAEKGDVAVTKYKTRKKMAARSTRDVQFASLALAQLEYIDTVWIGFAYIDDWGDEVIYWFPYDMVLDGDTGAIEYYPAY